MPGTYHEEVLVQTESLTLEGVVDGDQRAVLDGEGKLTTAIIGVDHGAGPDSVAWTMIHDMGATVGVVHIAPIEVVCPTCRAQPGEACDRRTMGRKWLYHRARVDAAGGGR